jgi:glycerol-3-phosphate O-acyltransferase
VIMTSASRFFFTQGRELFTNTLYNSVVNQYNVLKSAIFRDRGAAVSNNAISLSQPWR